VNEGISLEIRKFFLPFSSHTIVGTVLYFSLMMAYPYSQFLKPYLFCRLSSMKDAKHLVIMHALVGF